MKAILTKLKKINVINPKYGDFKLPVFPFNHANDLILPAGFEIWQKQINSILKMIPYQSNAPVHYLTIDSQFMTSTNYQRREGIHIDGNFCVDPDFKFRTWGGTGWAGTSIEKGKIIEAFKSPYDYKIPVGTYVSESLGGIICASSYHGCESWPGNIPNNVQNEGAYPAESLSHIKPIQLNANTLYFMSSNLPHRTLLIPAGTRRTLIRITLNHNYDNSYYQPELYEKLA